MIHEDLRTIRITLDAIRKEAFSHHYRNRALAVLRNEIDRIQQKNADFRDDSHLRNHSDVREQLTDGLRALLTLAHDGRDNDFGRDFEDHRQVNARLNVLRDLTTFLITKAEEHLPAKEGSMGSWMDEADAFIHMTITVTPVPTPPSVWDGVLDEIEKGDSDKDDNQPGDLEL
jgi:hypothetical protein